jgi:hypothetical protein
MRIMGQVPGLASINGAMAHAGMAGAWPIDGRHTMWNHTARASGSAHGEAQRGARESDRCRRSWPQKTAVTPGR